MKYLTLPIHLIKFWYPESLAFFIMTWKNLMLFLEEDLAVGLMVKLLFVPLFHDSSIVGYLLSLLFRVGRILIGLFAFAIATFALFVIGGYWLTLPVLAVFDNPEIVSRILFLTGLGLFIIHIVTHPEKKVWQVGKDNFWSASEVKKENINFGSLLKNQQVLDLLSNLELQIDHLPNAEMNKFFPSEIKNIEGLGQKAYELAKSSGSEYLGPRHFFVAILEELPGVDNVLLKLDLKLDDFKETLFYLEKKKNSWRRVYIWDSDFTIHHLKGVNRGWLGVPTPALELVGEDLTRTAAEKGFADFIRGSGVVKEVVNILSQQTGRNVILVGPPGSGKSALLHSLAKQIVTGDAPSALATQRLFLLDLTKLLSGVRTQGELAQRIKIIFDEVSFAQNIIIVIEEIHELGIGEAGSSLNLYSLIQPYLESDSFQFIGTTEEENYTKVLEKNGSFARLFRKIELPPATLQDTLRILEDRSITTERKDKIKISFLALKTVALLSNKLIHDRVLPDSAISILKEAETQSLNKWVTKDIVRRVISERSKVPLMEVGAAGKIRLLNLEAEIHGKLIDQQQAVKLVADTLRRAVTGMRDETRPIGSFLFVGPTGVGKTELAKTLSEVYFKTEGAFIRFDMSEYQNPQSVERLIGSAGEGGQLTEAVRERPYCLLLLDEFEKADTKILTLFLQVLDDGRLTDGLGRTIDFTNTIIIATSNAASLTIAHGLQAGQSLETLDKQVNEELLQIFKPELINRFDDVVLFKPLSQEDLQKIVRLKLAALQKQMKEQGYLVEFDEQLISELAQKGFDPVLGARPLRRLIQDTLEAKLSRLILEEKLVKGQTFRVGAELLG